MGIVYGALTSLSIGMADLFGRRVVHARGPIVGGAAIQFVAIFTSLVAVVIVEGDVVGVDMVVGAASGLGIGVGLWGYFAGLDRSSSAVVAPIVATMSAVIPYGYAVARGASPVPLAVVGAVLALVGLVIITVSGGRSDGITAGLRWGLVSGSGYGFGLSVIIEASDESGAWPSVAQRVAAFALTLAAATPLRLDVRPPPGLRISAGAAGVMAGLSTIFYLFGVRVDATSTVVLASLFPAVTVMVGRVVYHDEVRPRQIVGIGVVLLGVVGVSVA